LSALRVGLVWGVFDFAAFVCPAGIICPVGRAGVGRVSGATWLQL